MYHDSLTAEELQLLPASTAGGSAPALVHVGPANVEALVVPYDGERLTAAFSEVLRAPGMATVGQPEPRHEDTLPL